MKTIKHLFFLLAFSTLAFYSCSDDNPIEIPTSGTARESIALRTALNEIKNVNSLNGRALDGFCFDFVFPLTISLNNGTSITVSNYEGLLDLLADELPTVYVNGIVFPFQVMQGGAIVTIDTEGEFNTLLSNCGFVTFGGDLLNTMCFDILFPVSVVSEGQTLEFEDFNQFSAFINSQEDGQIQIVYPISVMYEGQIVTIANIYEMYEMINNCDQCICTMLYEPVCVETASGVVVEYGNMCFATCAGYTQNDLVECNPTTTCSIGSLSVSVGDCNPDSTYPVTINFGYSNVGTSTQFEVHNALSGALIGTYNLADLPVTISNFPNSNTAADFLTVTIVGNSGCFATQQWSNPCQDCGCPTDFDPVCVQDAVGNQIPFDNECLAACAGYTTVTDGPCTDYSFNDLLGSCFTIGFPVSIMGGGMVVEVDTNDEVLQYWQPSAGPMPMFVYPITVNFVNASLTVTVSSQAGFESLINTHCQ